MLEFSAPESLRAEIEYRQARARELARPVSAEHDSSREGSLAWLPRLFHRHGPSDGHDRKAGHRAA